jgi:hypothetical protein
MDEGEILENVNERLYEQTRGKGRQQSTPLMRPPKMGYEFAQDEAMAGGAELRNGRLRMQAGRYRGMHPSKANAKFREDYAALSGEEKNEFTRKAQGEDVLGPMDRAIKGRYDAALSGAMFASANGKGGRAGKANPNLTSRGATPAATTPAGPIRGPKQGGRKKQQTAPYWMAGQPALNSLSAGASKNAVDDPMSRPEYTPGMSDYERRQIDRVKNIQANWAGNQAEYDMNQAGKVAMQQRRGAHDEAFRRAYGTQPVQPDFYRANWNGGNRRPTGPGETVVDRATKQKVTPRINGVSPKEAIDAAKKQTAENAALDRQIGVGHITRGINSNGYPNPAPRTDIKGVGYGGNYDADDVRQWRAELAMQQSMQNQGRELQSAGKTKKFNKLQSEYNRRFGNLSQAEMQVRGQVLGQDYVGANRKIYNSRYRSTPLKPPSQP